MPARRSGVLPLALPPPLPPLPPSAAHPREFSIVVILSDSPLPSFLPCQHAGSTFFLGLSIFAVLFLSVLAGLINGGYPYAGEWFEAKAEPGHPVEPLAEQRQLAVANLWKAVGMYAAVGVVSGVAVCVHKLRGNL